MKERGKGDRRGPPTGTRTGPRARAAQERGYGDPYQRTERPPRAGPPRERLSAASGRAVQLDPDVARVFRDATSVNEALRAVIRLARLAGGRPSGPPRARPTFSDRDSGPRRRERGERPGAPRGPRFEED
jgi:hypothetical protein